MARETIGWARTRGRLACAYNMLGEHAKALEVCEHALAELDPGDLLFPAMNLNIQLEHAIAEAGLGRVDRAKQGLDRLIAIHGPQRGPITLGSIHDAYLRVAQQAKDFALCHEQLAKLELHCRPLALPSLSSRLELLPRPGDGTRSYALQRMKVREPKRQMPPIATRRVDDAGIRIIESWIDQMTTARGYPASAP